MDKRDLELLAYGLLGGKGNLGQNLSQAGLLMLQDRDQRKDRETRQKQQDIASQLQQMQLQQAQQQMADQGNIRQAFERNYQAPQAQQTAPFQADTFPGEAPIGGLSTITQQARPAGFNMQGLQADLMAAGPAGFQEAARIAQLNQRQAPKLEKLGQGDVLIDPTTGKQVAANAPKQPDWMNPQYQEFRRQVAREGAARVNVDNKQEGAFAKKVGEEFGTSYTDLMKSDALATSKITRFSRLGDLLSRAGNTGKLTPFAKDIASAARSLGIQVDDAKLGTQEAVQALSNEIALTLRNPAGGAGMPGALSDKDREFLVSMVPGLGNTPQGNQVMIQTAIKLAERERDVAKLARDYKKRNGRFDEGFYSELAAFSAQNPLFDNVAAPQVAPAGQPRVIDFNSLPNGR